MKLVSLLLCLLVACTDFADVQRGVCGNGLLEPGEDCDSDAANCVRCAVTCDPGDCPSAAYTCGVDGFCHAPGGELAEPGPPVTFQAEDLRVTDADRDGIGDVIGVSKTSIIFRNGDSGGTLAAGTSFVTPAQSGPAAFGDLDGDGTIDITLPTPDGIVSFTSRFGVLSPVAIESPLFDSNTGQPINFVQLFPVSRIELGGIVETDAGSQLVVVAFGLAQPLVFAAPPCAGRLGALAPGDIALSSIDLYRVTPDGAFNAELVLSFLTTAGKACVTSIHGNVLGYTFDDITPVAAGSLAHKPILADVDTDADPCPALINSDGGARALRQWDGNTVGGHCTLLPAGQTGTLLPPAPAAPPTAVAIGRIELVPQIGSVGRDALVLTSGVYGHVPVAIPLVFPQPTLAEIYSSNGRNLAFVATGDLDNDGDLDAVLATADQDDLDVLFRFPSGVQLLRIDTASQATSLTIGDFDGNGIRDIAYTETDGDHHDMMIAYGTSDRPLDPVRVATFSGVGSVIALEFPDTVDTLGIAEDLAILQPGAGANGASLLSLLHGSPQRTMLSFFDPRTDALKQTTVLRGAVIGDFVDAPQAVHNDLIAIGTPTLDGSAGMRAWKVAGTELGLDNTPSDGIAANGLADCTGSGVCVRDAAYLPWSTAPDHDLVIAVDREQPARAVVLDPFASAVGLEKTDIAVLLAGIPAGAVVRSLHAADLDGDGHDELIASFQSETAGEVRVCKMSSTGVPQDCTDLTAAIAEASPGVTACIDAAPAIIRDGTVATDPGTDLVVLCREAATTSLFRISGAASAITPLEAHAVGMTAIQTGDVTGDGVDDVIAMVGTGGSQSVIVFVQCTSRDVGSCRKISAAEGGP